MSERKIIVRRADLPEKLNNSKLISLFESLTVIYNKIFNPESNEGFDWDYAFKTVRFAMIDVPELFKQPKEVRAYHLIYHALRRSVVDIFSESWKASYSIGEEKPIVQPKNWKEMEKGLKLAFDAEDVEIDADFFRYPEQLPLLKIVKESFGPWLTTFGISKALAKVILARLPIYFAANLNELWNEKPQNYEGLKSEFQESFAEGRLWKRLEYQRKLHREWMTPIFDEVVGLDCLYIPLRAGLRIQGDGHEGWSKTQTKVVDTQTHILDWLRDSKSSFQLMLIKGGPGSGKSSLMKRLAQEITVIDPIQPFYFIELQHFDLEGGLQEAIRRYIHTALRLDENPFEDDLNGEFGTSVIVFDGLDELSQAGREGRELSLRFVTDLIHLLSRMGGRIRAIITGRDLVIQTHERELDDPKQVLEVLPYVLQEDQMFSSEKWIGPKALTKLNQQEVWWRQYTKLKGLKSRTPDIMKRDDFEEVSIQPLLNYLVALSYLDDPKKFDSGSINLNDIYYDFVKRVLKRPWGAHKHLSSQWKLDEFMEVMEEVAIAAWHTGDVRGCSFELVKVQCEGNSFVKKRIDQLLGGGDAAYLRLMTAFYTKPKASNLSEQSFEFTHKSFGEYLLACKIKRLVDSEWKKHRFDPDRYERAEGIQNVMRVFRLGEMDGFIDAFLRRAFQAYSKEEAHERQKLMVSLFNHAIDKSFEVDSRDYMNVIHQARLILSGMIHVMAALSDVSGEISEVDWKYETKARHVLGRLIRDHDAFVKRGFRRLRLKGMEFFLFDLHGANFFGANLAQANLRGAHLQLARLEEANLEGCNLSNTNMFYARLKGANLKGAVLNDTNLCGVNLIGANLNGSNFTNALFDDNSRISKSALGTFTCDQLYYTENHGADFQVFPGDTKSYSGEAAQKILRSLASD